MKKQLLIIPGNPCAPKYYNLWKKELEKNRNIECIVAKSEVLFDKYLNPEEYFLELESYYEKFMEKYNSKNPITVVGHSIGGYFALKLLEKYPKKIQKVILIFPYLGEESEKARKKLQRVYFFNKILVSKFVIKYNSFFQYFIRDMKLVSKRELIIAERLAINEYLFFKKNRFNFDLVGNNKVFLLYNENDEWCTNEMVEKLGLLVDSKRVEVSHKFVLDESQRKIMAKNILFYI